MSTPRQMPTATPVPSEGDEDVPQATVVEEASSSAFAAEAALPTGSVQVTTYFDGGDVNSDGDGDGDDDGMRLETRQTCLVEVLASPEVARRAPLHCCLVIDTSGSMRNDASVQTKAGGGLESTGLSILDVVKHSCKTLLTGLGPRDKMSIVSYSFQADVHCTGVALNGKGKRQVKSLLEGLTPGGCTNLWDGLVKGLDIMGHFKTDGCHRVLYLLTDGMPNVEPPRGHIPTLARYIEQKRLPCAVHTAGFGYHMDSPLLRGIARLGAGTYSFIPDAGMVGTVFCNAIANAMSLLGNCATLRIELPRGVKVEAEDLAVLEALFPVQTAEWGLQISIGGVHVGQSRTFLLNLNLDLDTDVSGVAKGVPAGGRAPAEGRAPARSEAPSASLTYTTAAGALERAASMEAETGVGVAQPLGMMRDTQARFAFMKCLSTIVERLDLKAHLRGAAGPPLPALVAATLAQLKAGGARAGLVDDLAGQVSEAVDSDANMAKWGVHYIPSLLFAHSMQLCNNFKDPGVQAYGQGKLFNEARDKAEKGFTALPPPKPSFDPTWPPVQGVQGGMGRLYMSRGNPCFGPDGAVAIMAESRAEGDPKKYKRVADVRAGDVLASGAVVACVVRTRIASELLDMVRLPGGLLVTPFHPVWHAAAGEPGGPGGPGEWVFPCELAPASAVADVGHIFSFALRPDASAHCMDIDGVQCVTLGHAFRSGRAAHPYFGSQSVLQDLAELPGWSEGLVDLQQDSMIRDPTTGLISGIATRPSVFPSLPLSLPLAVPSPASAASGMQASKL